MPNYWLATMPCTPLLRTAITTCAKRPLWLIADQKP